MMDQIVYEFSHKNIQYHAYLLGRLIYHQMVIYYEFYKDIQLPEENNNLRSKIRLNLNENNFERFISIYIPKNFPKSFLEENKNSLKMPEMVIIWL